jgi:nucleoside-diphosphate-sugar epimerase
MILFNGATGSLGRYFLPAFERAGLKAYSLQARLEDVGALNAELDALSSKDQDADITFIPLAAKVSVPACEKDSNAAFQTNVIDLLATVRTVWGWARSRERRLRLLYVSTGHVYAKADEGTRLAESHSTKPRSVYAATKLEAENRLRELVTTSRGLSLTIARVFGLIAPQQPDSYVLPGLVRRAASGDSGPLPGLHNVRDYLDSRDVATHVIGLLQLPWGEGDARLLNVCSGEATSIRDLLALVLSAAGRDALLPEFTEAPGRRDDVPYMVGDPSALLQLTKTPARFTPLQQTAVEAWRLRAGGTR